MDCIFCNSRFDGTKDSLREYCAEIENNIDYCYSEKIPIEIFIKIIRRKRYEEV